MYSEYPCPYGLRLVGIFSYQRVKHQLLVKDMENDAYLIAKNGGANHGWYKLQRELPESKIRKGIRSFEEQIELHRQWIENPLTKTPDFYSLDLRRQENLVNFHWPSDIKRHQDFITILQGILQEKAYGKY